MLTISTTKIIRNIWYFLRRPKVRGFLTYFFFILLGISCLLTYRLFTEVDRYKESSQSVISILYFDVACVLILLMLGSQKILDLWSNRHKKGSRLTMRLILLFSVGSLIPSIFMTCFSAFFFHNGIDYWFNERNKTVLQESLKAAESYIGEHKKQLINDSYAIAKTITYHLDRQADLHDQDFEKFSENLNPILNDLCALKNLKAAILTNSAFGVIAHSSYSVGLHFLNLREENVASLKERSCEILKIRGESEEDQQVIRTISCFKTDSGEYLYLIIEKKIDPTILLQVKNAKQAYNEYFQLLEDRGFLEMIFIVMFLIVGIVLLIGSVVIAIFYSWQIVKPISNLIDASENIISGNLRARVSEEESKYPEITTLLKTFNQMVSRVQRQREDLIEINRKLDERIKFTSSVLAGVSSGVIGIDNNAIYVWNGAAEKLLGHEISFGEHICNIIPEIENMLSNIDNSGSYSNEIRDENNNTTTSSHGNWISQKEISYRKGHTNLLLSVKIAHIETSSDYYSRYVITFDDLTNIVMAQKKAAWSEIARRVAHEIKNPLTPIQLSAERIRRKYLTQISNDPETFTELVEVIIRQVGDIKRLIDNFTQFAKLPDPVLHLCNIYEICKQAVFLIQNASEDVKIELTTTNADVTAKVDERLFHQSIVNLVKNAVNVLRTVSNEEKTVRISIVTEENRSEKSGDTNHRILVQIEDNGPGFPKEKMDLLATPYFTLMPKGTGLGLAIVKKIIQDQGGELLFGNSSMGGAKVTISIPS